MKTASQVYEQSNRLSLLLDIVTRAAIKRADPRTGGSTHLAHNWGKDCRPILDQYYNRQHLLFNLGRKHYEIATNRERRPGEPKCKVQMY